jgi:hypothetical protein
MRSLSLDGTMVSPWRLAGTLAGLMFIAGCSAPTPPLQGSARAYADAKDEMLKGNFERAASFTDNLVTGTPDAYTERARVLRAVLLAGEMNGYRSLAEAYQRGSEAAKRPGLEGEYRRLRNDNLEYWSKLALGLAELGQQLSAGGSFPKELTLEAPYPTVEGPVTVAALHRIEEGAEVSPDDQLLAARDAQRKGIDDVLAAVAGGGDRAKARSALSAGPVKLDGVAFALYLTKEILAGGEAYDNKHLNEPSKYAAVYGAAEQTFKAAEALLKQNPNPEEEKEAKQVEAELKAAKKKVAA